MQELLQAILECEEAYLNCFCEKVKEENYIRYTDALLPDMYAYNFIEVGDKVTKETLKELIQAETQRSIDNKARFCKIKVPKYPQEPVVSCNGKSPEQETLGTYLCNLDLVKNWRQVTACEVKRIANGRQIEELIALDLIQDEATCGASFCKRRAIRKGQVYISDTGCDSYICYYDGKPVGSCDLFINRTIAKIEDFSVSPEYQRKGIGTTILKALVERAQEQGAKNVYLNTEEDDTAKEMYMKLGFTKVAEFYSLIWERL
ncbi:MAG: GNAT family N-acetyltransferase [Cellulosilyticum sp.]|nr:GNAT family N-acetyltransferase [Cellulosilyticum sp.]